MKIFRDPVHNVINLDTGNKAINKLIIKLIDSPEFQRLRRIKQLGFADLAYPNATHTRFAHSLGVAFLTKRFFEKIISLEERLSEHYDKFDKLQEHNKIVEFFEQIKRDKPPAIIAALLHDIGHGILSHVTEDIIGINHEEWARGIILGNTGINKLLSEFNTDYPQIICDILNSKGDHLYSGKIINGAVDVDKMDYLLRDSHMTGSGYGRFDIEWLFNVLTAGIKDGRIIIGLDEGKGLSVAEDFVTARIYMLKNVYLHKTSLVAQEMLKMLFKRLKELHEAVNHFIPDESMQKIFFLPKNEKDIPSLLPDYLAISDEHYYSLLASLQNSKDDVLKKLSSGLYNRILCKEIDKDHWHGLNIYIRETKGMGMEKYYAFEVKVDSVEKRLTYQIGKDEIFLFDKSGEARELLTKSLIAPLIMRDYEYHLGYYADTEIYNQYLLKICD